MADEEDIELVSEEELADHLKDTEPVSKKELANRFNVNLNPDDEEWNNKDHAYLAALLLRVEGSIDSLEESLCKIIDNKSKKD